MILYNTKLFPGASPPKKNAQFKAKEELNDESDDLAEAQEEMKPISQWMNRSRSDAKVPKLQQNTDKICCCRVYNQTRPRTDDTKRKEKLYPPKGTKNGENVNETCNVVHCVENEENYHSMITKIELIQASPWKVTPGKKFFLLFYRHSSGSRKKRTKQHKKKFLQKQNVIYF